MYLQRNKEGYVYVAYNKGLKGLVKIGATTKDPLHRLKVISNQSVPYPFQLLASFKSCDCLGFEQYVHQNLTRYHVKKEFFKLDKSESVRLVEMLGSTYQKKATRV
mgnify:CR=1 FL=1|tara:strand:- start:2560 stop:2877 length:318 start_codon:yes stop_codon:yes gene_type:complete